MQDEAAEAELAADIAARGLLQNLVAKVAKVTFALDPRLGKRAGFRRNEQMLSLKPRYLVAFAGSGVLERLVVQAKAQGIAVVDRRGPALALMFLAITPIVLLLFFLGLKPMRLAVAEVSANHAHFLSSNTGGAASPR